ncbi:MAG: hypothetical protein K2O18_05970 [Oscillospiraceae bacterium]|nr:hypothetical protein [Oscillospiraceae bacterium]
MASVSGLNNSDYMKEYALDLNNRGQSTNNTDKTQGATSTDFSSATSATKDREREPNNELTFEDMLSLMIVQLQNQTIDNTADTNDMMNQLISMTVMNSLTTLTSAVEEVQLASVMNYSASLVGQYVTLGVYNEKTKNLDEIYGLVEASGTYDGKQVIFVDGQSYLLSSIMAVGKLPPVKKEDGEQAENSGNVENTDQTDNDHTENKDVENAGAAESGGDAEAGAEDEAGGAAVA